MNSYKENKTGFSMVEISIICCVVIVLLVPVFALMSRGSSTTIRNRNEILAQQYASNLIAYCNAVPFDNDYLAETEGKSIPELSVNDKVEKIEDIFTRTLSVKEFSDDSLGSKYKLVSVKVEWQQPGEAKKRSVILSGLVTEL
jgi:hypothetical protein